jgi:hypothetical protein
MNQTRLALALALAEVVLNPAGYREDFYDWLSINGAIYLAFEREADYWRLSRGKKRWGHRTVWEYLRRESALREATGNWKLNDHYTKCCARLYVRLHPGAEHFFSFREVSVGDLARAS